MGSGNSWTDISKTIGTRSPDRTFPHMCKHTSHPEQADASPECAKRWRNSLDPNNSRSEWTEEDVKLRATL